MCSELVLLGSYLALGVLGSRIFSDERDIALSMKWMISCSIEEFRL